MRLYRNVLLGAVLGLAFPHQSAGAYTECSVQISRVFSGDDGMIWMFYAQGGAAYLAANDPDKEATLTLAMTALVASRPVVVRYQANGVTCTETRSDLIGFFLN